MKQFLSIIFFALAFSPISQAQDLQNDGTVAMVRVYNDLETIDLLVNGLQVKSNGHVIEFYKRGNNYRDAKMMEISNYKTRSFLESSANSHIDNMVEYNDGQVDGSTYAVIDYLAVKSNGQEVLVAQRDSQGHLFVQENEEAWNLYQALNSLLILREF